MYKAKIAATFPAVISVTPGAYYWCSCGKARRQPFCDGSHEGTGFAPMRVEVTDQKMIAFCQCKQTRSAPHCDNSHMKLR